MLGAQHSKPWKIKEGTIIQRSSRFEVASCPTWMSWWLLFWWQEEVPQKQQPLLGAGAKVEFTNLNQRFLGKLQSLRTPGLPLRWLLLPSTCCKRRRSGAWSESMGFSVAQIWRAPLEWVEHDVSYQSSHYLPNVSSVQGCTRFLPLHHFLPNFNSTKQTQKNLTWKQWRSWCCKKKHWLQLMSLEIEYYINLYHRYPCKWLCKLQCAWMCIITLQRHFCKTPPASASKTAACAKSAACPGKKHPWSTSQDFLLR